MSACPKLYEWPNPQSRLQLFERIVGRIENPMQISFKVLSVRERLSEKLRGIVQHRITLRAGALYAQS